MSRRADALAAAREPFVTAVVVRAQRPSSVRAGDSALVLRDGTIEGFVGGACAEPAVRLHALHVLETGDPLLLRIEPGDGSAPAQDGAVTVQNPCLSGGALEIFLEPRLPAPRVVALGDSPVSLALADVGSRVGLDVEPVAIGDDPDPRAGDLAFVAASHGRGEEEALARALRAGIPYVGLGASRKRGASVVDELRAAGVADEDLARLRTPAGLDIGARTAEEIALSVLAEIVAERRAREKAVRVAAPVSAVDPVCGMTVAAVDSTPHVELDGTTTWFCCPECRKAFLAEPARYAPAS
jgi:xanthine dehydrogenase accessory factor